MKQLRLFTAYLHYRVLLCLGASLFFTTALLAQDKKVDIDVGVKDSSWYQQPWAWVLGAAVFILLLVAILRSGRKDA